MNSYERVMAVLDGKKEETDRLPCMSSVGTYTKDFMKAYDAYWPDSHKDPEKMAKLASAAHRLCGLDSITVPFDMLVEAELLGVEVEYHEDKIKWPSIKSFKIKDVSDLKIPRDIAHEGRIPIITKAIEILKEEFEGKVPVNVYMAPPFTSISSYMLDTSTFLLWTKTKPDKIHEICKAAFDVYTEIVEIYGEAGADIIKVGLKGVGDPESAIFLLKQVVKATRRQESATVSLFIHNSNVICALLEHPSQSYIKGIINANGFLRIWCESTFRLLYFVNHNICYFQHLQLIED